MKYAGRGGDQDGHRRQGDHGRTRSRSGPPSARKAAVDGLLDRDRDDHPAGRGHRGQQQRHGEPAWNSGDSRRPRTIVCHAVRSAPCRSAGPPPRRSRPPHPARPALSWWRRIRSRRSRGSRQHLGGAVRPRFGRGRVPPRRPRPLPLRPELALLLVLGLGLLVRGDQPPVAGARWPAARRGCPGRRPGPRSTYTTSSASAIVALRYATTTTVADPAASRSPRRIRDSTCGSTLDVASSSTSSAGPADQRPGQRQPLPLAAGQGGPALADLGVEAARQGGHEAVGLGQPQRAPDRLVVDVADPSVTLPRTVSSNRNVCWATSAAAAATPPRRHVAQVGRRPAAPGRRPGRPAGPAGWPASTCRTRSGPTTATVRPGATSKVTSCSTSVAVHVGVRDAGHVKAARPAARWPGRQVGVAERQLAGGLAAPA